MTRIFPILLLAAPACTLAEAPVSCSWSETFVDGSSRGGAVAVYLEVGKISRLVFESEASSGKEGGGYLCDYDSQNPDTHTTQSATADSIRFVAEVGDPAPEFAVKKVGASYVISQEYASYFCGFGAEFPSVVVLPGKEKCKVSYP